MTVVCLWFLKPASAKKVAELCLRFSPQIAIRHNEAVFVEIGKCRHLYTPEGFARQMQNLLREMDVEARMAIGTDITDALVRAVYKTRDIGSLPLEALLEFADPFHKDVVGRKYVLKMIRAFQDLGVNDLAQFNRVPMSDLISRFGPIGILCRQRLNFEVPIGWPLWKPEAVIKEKIDFPYFEFYGELEPLLFELKKQLDGIFQRLWARGLKAQKMQVRVYCETNSHHPEAIRKFDFEFLFPQSSTKGALGIIKERLIRDFEKNPVRTPIEAVETIITGTVTDQAGQKNLLHRREEISEQKQALLGQLTEVHGREKIFHAQLVPDRRPEHSWKKAETLTKQETDFTTRIPLRPTHIIKPEPVVVTSGFIHIRRKVYKVRAWAKPVEHITGGWQEDAANLENSYDRRYYTLELENGSRLSVFQTPDQKFFLHGYFG